MLICVDLDGTLLDTVPANAASYRAALEELGFTVTDEYYAERCNGGHYTRFLPPLMGGAPSAADLAQYRPEYDMYPYFRFDKENFYVGINFPGVTETNTEYSISRADAADFLAEAYR